MVEIRTMKESEYENVREDRQIKRKRRVYQTVLQMNKREENGEKTVLKEKK